MPALKPIAPGTRFGRLVVLKRSSGKEHRLLCECDCGSKKTIVAASLRHGQTRSCGCLQKERAIESRRIHGHCGSVRKASRTYTTWRGMMQRCTNPTHNRWERYGGRGITVCERWLKFENFLADMGERPPGKTIDRYPDTNGNYEPGNCRWATAGEQSNNRRSNRTITVGGVTRTMAQWARALGMKYQTLGNASHRGKDLGEIIAAHTMFDGTSTKGTV